MYEYMATCILLFLFAYFICIVFPPVVPFRTHKPFLNPNSLDKFLFLYYIIFPAICPGSREEKLENRRKNFLVPIGLDGHGAYGGL